MVALLVVLIREKVEEVMTRMRIEGSQEIAISFVVVVRL